jgi:hypothetical protein
MAKIGENVTRWVRSGWNLYMTVDDVSEHLMKFETLIKLFQTSLSQDMQEKIQFGIVGRAEYCFMIVSLFDSTEMKNVFLTPAGRKQFLPIQGHDWFHFLMVT